MFWRARALVKDNEEYIEREDEFDYVDVSKVKHEKYGNFDTSLVHPTRVFQPSTTPIVPCDRFYLMTMLVGC